MYNLENLKPVFTSDLVRIGRNRDGGYVINRAALQSAEVLLSFGISTDWSFDSHWWRYRNGQRRYLAAYDFSVSLGEFLKFSGRSFREWLSAPAKFRNLLFGLHYLWVAARYITFFDEKNKRFFQKGIGAISNDVFLGIDDILLQLPFKPSSNSILIKMDIEGAEYEMIPQLHRIQDSIAAIVVEFHDLDKRGKDLDKIADELRHHGYCLTHIHPNNGGAIIPGTQLPGLLEITFVKESILSPEEIAKPNTRKYPLAAIDFPCVKRLPELSLDFSETVLK